MLHPLGEDCFYVAVCQGIKNAPAIPAEFYQTHLLQDPELVGEVLKVIRELADQNTTMIRIKGKKFIKPLLCCCNTISNVFIIVVY